jgi:hypothetical protein
LPRIGLFVEVRSTAGCALERLGRIVVEQEPGDIIVDCVGQSADPSCDRERAVQLGAHLREPARLVQRRHEQNVSASHQFVLSIICERQLHADPVT